MKRGKEGGQGLFVIGFGGILIADCQAAIAMIGNGNYSGILIGFGVIQSNLDGIIKGQHIADNSHRIIGVSGPVYLGALYHQEKAFIIFGQHINGFLGHFSKGRLLVRVPVHLISHSTRGK
ncbi:hypothetical protein D3C75_1069890 [compost metagenome]